MRFAFNLFKVSATAFIFLASAHADDTPYALHKKFELSPPPSPGSVQEKADFKEMEELQKIRTAADCKRAETEQRISLVAFFGPPYGPLTVEQIQKAEPVYGKLMKTSSKVVHQLKDKWGRPRPYEVDKKLSPCVGKEPSKAYPSGHAEAAAMISDFLIELYPAYKKELQKRAQVLAKDRVLGGVHHPTDIKSGLRLGHEIFSEIAKYPRFKTDLEALKP